MRQHGIRYIVILIFFLSSLAIYQPVAAQCSICTRTAQQLGEKPARGLNTGIMYLAFTPLILIGFIGYAWYRKNQSN